MEVELVKQSWIFINAPHCLRFSYQISTFFTKNWKFYTRTFELHMKTRAYSSVICLTYFAEDFFLTLLLPFSTDPGVSKHSATCQRGVCTTSTEKGIWQLGQYPSQTSLVLGEPCSVRLLRLSWVCTLLSSLPGSRSSLGLNLCSLFWGVLFLSTDFFLFPFPFLFGLHLPLVTVCMDTEVLFELLCDFCFLIDLYSQMSSSNKASSDMATYEILSLHLSSSSQI